MSSLTPGAATPRLRAWFARSAGRGTVVHAGHDAVYAEVRGRCVGVLARAAVHVPCGVRTLLPSLAARAGDPVELAGGQLTVAGCSVRVSRTVPVRMVRFHDPARAHAELRRQLLPRIRPVLAELDDDALAALAAGDPIAAHALLGRGGGLTPLGDDVLSGWLASTPGPSHVSTEVARLAPHRTTALSAQLLDCARHGETVPQFGRLARELDGRPSGCRTALEDLLAVGHTSGAGLALGCLLALAGRVEMGGRP